MLRSEGEFDEYELDDYLGYFELMAHYNQDLKILEFDLIDEMFGHYIARAYEHPEIEKYINDYREERKDNRYYKPFTDLAEKISAREKEEQAKFKT